MTFLLPVIAILLITTALTASMSLTQKAPKVKRKEDTIKNPESLALYQDYLKQQGLTGSLTGAIDPIVFARIRDSLGEDAAKRTLNPKLLKPVENLESLAPNQGFKGPIDPILLSRIRTSFGEEAAVNFISKHQAGGPRSELGNKSQTRRGATTERYSRDVDDDTFISYSSHSSYDPGCHDYGSSHDYGGHDCGGHDFGGFDCGSD
jgi:hypothetical protein